MDAIVFVARFASAQMNQSHRECDSKVKKAFYTDEHDWKKLF